ncbi:ENV1 protein, partial [Oenanthe oenanthe]|nr:ENV1 protein [Oenanthe oenanthe]
VDPQQNTLWSLMYAAYQVLNATKPDLTEHCWLCFDIKPPFYEAIGVTEKARWSNGSNPTQCDCKGTQTQGITLAAVTGKGRCIR